MTEYDFSPEATSAFRSRMNETGRWVDRHQPSSFDYYTPSQQGSDGSRDSGRWGRDDDDDSDVSSGSIPPRLVLDYGNGNVRRIPHPLDYQQSQRQQPYYPQQQHPGYPYQQPAPPPNSQSWTIYAAPPLSHPPPPPAAPIPADSSRGRRHRHHHKHSHPREDQNTPPPPEPEQIRVLPSKGSVHKPHTRDHIRSRSLPRDVVQRMEAEPPLGSPPPLPIPPPRPGYGPPADPRSPSHTQPLPSNPHYQNQAIYNHPPQVGPNGMVFSHSAPQPLAQPQPLKPYQQTGAVVPPVPHKQVEPFPPPPGIPHQAEVKRSRSLSVAGNRNRTSSSISGSLMSDATTVYGRGGYHNPNNVSRGYSLKRTPTSTSSTTATLVPSHHSHSTSLTKSIFRKLKDVLLPVPQRPQSAFPVYQQSLPQVATNKRSGSSLRRAATPVILPTPGLASVNYGKERERERGRRHSTGHGRAVPAPAYY